MSHILLPCDLTLVNSGNLNEWSRTVTSSRWILRSRSNVDLNHQKRAATCDAYRVAIQQRIAARRALKWIGTSKAWLDFGYEISDLLASMADIQ